MQQLPFLPPPPSLLPAPPLLPSIRPRRKRSLDATSTSYGPLPGGLPPIDEMPHSEAAQDHNWVDGVPLPPPGLRSPPRGATNDACDPLWTEEEQGQRGYPEGEERRPPKRLRPTLENFEPAFASLTLAPVPVPVPPPAGPPLLSYLPAPSAGNAPFLPVTPPLQQGSAFPSAGEPLLQRTPTPSPRQELEDEDHDVRMGGPGSSYEIAPNVIYVSSLEDSDDEDARRPGGTTSGTNESESPMTDSDADAPPAISLHPAFLAALPKPFPTSLLPLPRTRPREADELGLVLYRPLTFGTAGGGTEAKEESARRRAEEYEEYRRKAEKEERELEAREQWEDAEVEEGRVGAGTAGRDEDGDEEMMDLDG